MISLALYTILYQSQYYNIQSLVGIMYTNYTIPTKVLLKLFLFLSWGAYKCNYKIIRTI